MMLVTGTKILFATGPSSVIDIEVKVIDIEFS